MGTSQGQGPLGGAANKITKARSKVVKPILKKLSHTEKNSLDLDRGWDEQQQMDGWGGIGGFYEPPRSAKDVSFKFGERGEPSGRGSLSGAREGVTGSSGSTARKAFQHGRSPSGNSHISIATTGSGGGIRAGTFVHPFQQMPRTSTPPLSYANSLASFDNNSNVQRDYSPTITENEDDGDSQSGSNFTSNLNSSHINGNSLPSHLHLSHHAHHSSFSSYHHPTISTHSSTYSQTGLRRPSLASQRTSSLTDITSALTSAPQQIRINTTGRSTPSGSRLAPSKSDLHLNLTLAQLESPTGSASGTPVAATPATVVSPSSSAAPLSPLRTSLEAMGLPRLRSRSEVDTAARQEHIRQARRKFEERERAKEEKYDREHVRKRNRQATEEATRIEKETAQWYKATGVSSSGGVVVVAASSGVGSVNGSSVHVNLNDVVAGSAIAGPPPAVTKGGRPSASRRNTPTNQSASAGSVPSGRSLGSSFFSGGRRKGSLGGAGGTAASSRHDLPSGGSGSGNHPGSRKNSGFGKTPENSANVVDAEKRVGFMASNYESLPGNQRPPRFGASIDEVGAGGVFEEFRPPGRTKTAKKKTQTAWQGFVLWLRTKIFRLSGR